MPITKINYDVLKLQINIFMRSDSQLKNETILTNTGQKIWRQICQTH